MAQMNMIEAIRSAMDVMMDRDPNVVVLGEDVGYFGGVFRCTDGLQRKYGEHRVIDAPIAEGGIIGTAIGMGVNGLRPIAEIQFADYIYPGFDQIVSELARLRYRSCGEFFSPVTIRTPCGGGIRGGQTHSQSPEGIFTHVSGIKTVMPSNPYDAKGLLIASIESDDPVVFFEPKRIYNGPFDGDPDKPAVSWASHPKGEVPEGHYTVPLGQAEVVRPGTEITIVTYGTLVHVAVAAAEATGVDAEVIDLKSLSPVDLPTMTDSVKKTGRCLIAHEATRFGGYGAELVASIQKECFYYLEAPDRARRRLGHALPACVRVAVLPGQEAPRGRHPQSHGDGGMSEYVFKLPDLGEGTVESEIGEWFVKVGDLIEEEAIVGTMMTDKAAVEVSSPVSGRIVKLAGEPGDMVAVGAPLVVFQTDTAGQAEPAPAGGVAAVPAAGPLPGDAATGTGRDGARETSRIITSPAIRRRAREQGIDLAGIAGSGANGRILRQDFEAHVGGTADGRSGLPAAVPGPGKSRSSACVGSSRSVWRRRNGKFRTSPMSRRWTSRNSRRCDSISTQRRRPRKRGSRCCRSWAWRWCVRYAASHNAMPPTTRTVTSYSSTRLCISALRHRRRMASRSPSSVMPKSAISRIWLRRCAASQTRRATTARKKMSSAGSTITITSLGKLGGIASTPVINLPEVGIIGVNRAVERPVVLNGQIAVRLMMNLSTSFDHRFVDGYDAAAMVQELKEMLEHPATIFV